MFVHITFLCSASTSRAIVLNTLFSVGSLSEPHFMAVVVESKEEVLKVQVSPKGVRPDPVVARTGDIICWMWPKHVLSSISEVAGNDEDDVFFSNRFLSFLSPPRAVSRNLFLNARFFYKQLHN